MIFEKPVIDSHMHVHFYKNDQGEDFYQFFDRKQAEHGLKAINLCACPCVLEKNGGSWGVENNILAALYKLHNPTAYAYGGFFYPTIPAENTMPAGMELDTQYRELMDLGFDGIKMLETKAEEQKKFGLFVDDQRFEPFFAQCEGDGTHIVWHVADPDSFWDLDRIHPRHLAKGWYYGEGDYMSWQSIYDMVERVLERHPKLKVTFAHFFFWSPWPEKLEQLFAKYENVAIDITPGAEMYGFFLQQYDRYRQFFINYADRIFYGTDVVFPSSKTNSLRSEQVYRFLTTDEEITLVDIPTKGLALPDEASEKILYRNFEQLAGNEPKPIDRAKLRQYIEKYLPYIQNQDALPHIREQLKLL